MIDWDPGNDPSADHVLSGSGLKYKLTSDVVANTIEIKDGGEDFHPGL